MPDQVPEKIKNQRSDFIRQVSDDQKRKYRQSLIGNEQTVLIEKIINGEAHGYGEHYVPVKFPALSSKSNEFVKVKLVSLEKGSDPEFMGERI
jgi:threonylcarbamoyladenosine tRNA methylthiotransferase MtaB